MYEKLFRPIFFRLDPEQAHALTIKLLKISGSNTLLRDLTKIALNAHSHYIPKQKYTYKIFNLKFPNIIGLAAGYDKDALAWKGLTSLGFGHIEVGTVTPIPQNGNQKPRIFRIPEEQAVINRMGFPGKGANFVAMNIAGNSTLRKSVILGVNIGKNKDTPIEDAYTDYLQLLEIFYPLADYLTVNISSPNTVGLRRLQGREYLERLLSQLKRKRTALKTMIPILVKLSPDLKDDELDDALSAIITSEMDGVIATNTTICRTGLSSPIKRESGGLSGAPLRSKSINMVKDIYSKTAGKLPIIGVGGIMNADDAKAMLDSGASLIQLYTGLVYRGPGLVYEILKSL
jgi:dihydroorotate dehydrogenase